MNRAEIVPPNLDFWTLPQLANELGLSLRRVQQLIKEGQIPARETRWGKRVVFKGEFYEACVRLEPRGW